MDNRQTIQELKERHDFERGARWAAEENLAWVIAAESAWLAHLYEHQWWLTAVVGVGSFFLIARYFGRREESAEDAYYKAAGLGRYYKPGGGE
jgi:hypothetical protein